MRSCPPSALLRSQQLHDTNDTTGPAMPATRVYLSPATLVVVPAPLIGHWMHQLATHTRGGLLRVAVLGEVSIARNSGSILLSGPCMLCPRRFISHTTIASGPACTSAQPSAHVGHYHAVCFVTAAELVKLCMPAGHRQERRAAGPGVGPQRGADHLQPPQRRLERRRLRPGLPAAAGVPWSRLPDTAVTPSMPFEDESAQSCALHSRISVSQFDTSMPCP